MNLFRHIGTVLAYPWVILWRWVFGMWSLQNRERIRLWSQMSQLQGLMPLLMKQRNGYRWTDEDRHQIRHHLDQLLAMSPYLILFVAPGGFFLLPILAWWLDRRRLKRAANLRHPFAE